jgi:hypothetical protein
VNLDAAEHIADQSEVNGRGRELAHEMSVLDEPVLDEVDSTPKLRDAEGLTIEELTSLLAEWVRE